MRRRWDVSYDLQLVVRNKNLVLQLMWKYLEQQTFPLSEKDYLIHLNEILEIINRTGNACLVRNWLSNVQKAPKIGSPLSIRLKNDAGLGEFIVQRS